jgi:hypothetical protein
MNARAHRGNAFVKSTAESGTVHRGVSEALSGRRSASVNARRSKCLTAEGDLRS